MKKTNHSSTNNGILVDYQVFIFADGAVIAALGVGFINKVKI